MQLSENDTFIGPANFLGFTIIWEDLSVITEALRQHTNVGFKDEKNPEQNYKIELSSLNLKRVCFGNPVYSPNPQGLCLFEPTCSPFWSVWVSNLPDGWNSFLRVLCAKHGWNALQVRSSKLNLGKQWIQEMKLIRGPAISRIVRVMWDGRPSFYDEGTPMFCEDVHKYANGPIRKRLTREDIFKHMTDLGLPVYASSFWITAHPATYLWRTWPAPCLS